MAAPKTTVWEIEPHTRAKHEILKLYLQAWAPILSLGGFPEVLYIDGFSGPGRYSKGEDGSPIIALKTALSPKPNLAAQIFFHFIELKEDRAQMLRSIVDSIAMPPNFHVTVVGNETFEAAFHALRQEHVQRRGRLPPTFAFIDPFGWSRVSFSIVKAIMSFQICEVLITFMYEEINRFLSHADQPSNFDTFFGTDKWRDGSKLEDKRQRNRFLHDLYLSQLRTEASAKFVRSFQMRNSSGLTDYYLFHATNNLRGLKKMKEAMWRVDQSGEFTFSDATDPNQMVLFAKNPRYDELGSKIVSGFRGKTVSVEEIEYFVLTETAFRETHYKRIFKALETSTPPSLEPIDAPSNRKRGTFPDPKLRLRFLQQ